MSVPVDPLTTDESRTLVTRLLGGDRGEREPQAVADLADSCARLPLAIRIATVGLAAEPTGSVAAAVDELTCGGRLDALALDEDAGLAVRPAFDLSTTG
ncbi:hypothetical protein E1293_17945 [Actinomadura darangshiensis]|uniref:Uncharacterized protein n=1 Tax=Actinomadura darangshiensis TaxID=705336 RepID=A0A4R5B682_9ACTN|nr:hypothetical protein [Actinomadura darangshiensis]TDD81778.1 hypothetical protein E1293_17945 [Actinomadura darangshiensis]